MMPKANLALCDSYVVWARNRNDLVCKVSPVRGMNAPDW